MSRMTIRQGGPDDLEAVMRVMTAAFDPHYGEAWTAGQCLGVMAMRGSTLHLAEMAGRGVGFALARAVADQSELMLLAVDPSARRLGIGRALLMAVIAEARSLSIKTLHLEVRSGNDAIALYSSAGLEQVGRRLRYYRNSAGEQFDAETYRLILT